MTATAAIGFLALTGLLPCVACAQTLTRLGAVLLDLADQPVEELHTCRKRGYAKQDGLGGIAASLGRQQSCANAHQNCDEQD
jgi:hypothetical protein